jgi:hypothetical protein
MAGFRSIWAKATRWTASLNAPMWPKPGICL